MHVKKIKHFIFSAVTNAGLSSLFPLSSILLHFHGFSIWGPARDSYEDLKNTQFDAKHLRQGKYGRSPHY